MKPLLRSCALILVVLLLSAPSLSAEESPSTEPQSGKQSAEKFTPGVQESKRSSESSQTNPKKNNKTATGDKKNSDKPIRIEIVESDYLNKTSQQDDTYKKENLELQRQITNFTQQSTETQKELSRYTFILAVVAAAQVFLLFVQLYLMRVNIRVAISATGAATTSANAAEAAVRVASETAKKELRAYVGCDHVAIWDNPVRGEIVVKNFGKTMAKDVKVHMAGTYSVVTNLPAGLQFGAWKGNVAVMPNESVRFDETISVNPEQREALIRGNGAAYVWGTIEYKDVFDGNHWTMFRFMTDGGREEIARGGRIVHHWKTATCTDGNDAN